MDQTAEQGFVKEFISRLNRLYETCRGVALEEGASFEEGASLQSPFSSFLGGQRFEQIPDATIHKGNTEVKLRPDEINQDPTTGKYYAGLFVIRTMIGKGNSTSPHYWTDLDSPSDSAWYADPAWQKTTVVTGPLIKSWLHHDGPPPIW
jgi:hypothetical protein